MSSWDTLRESTERLRLCTARMKANRLKLPQPGALVRIRAWAMLYPVNFDDRGAEFNSWTSDTFSRGELLMLVCVNMHPPEHPKGPLVDPVEFFFMGKGGALYTTGTKAAGDIMVPFEVVS